jgi:Phytanoyl-CoA dioxygenase (PhyH)
VTRDRRADRQSLLHQLREAGFTVVPGVLKSAQVDRWRDVVDEAVERSKAFTDQAFNPELWPFGAAFAGHPLYDLYRADRIGAVAAQFMSPKWPPAEPEFAQIAITNPPLIHRPSGPHLDGISPSRKPDGRPGTFTLLVGVILSDQSEPDCGNLYVWPGTHLVNAAWLRANGADALGVLDRPYPPTELPASEQVLAAPGDLILAHYLLGHNSGGHFGRAADPRRETVYFRLQSLGHRQRWRAAVSDPLGELAEPDDK